MAGKYRAPGEPGGGAHAGDPRGGGASDAPAQPGTGVGGTTPPAAPAPPVTPSLSIDVLPEALRGMPENQIKFTLNRMAESLAATNRRNAELEAQLRAPKPGQSHVITEQPKPGEPKKSLDVRLLEEPEAALDEFLQSRFGTAVQKLNDLDDRLGKAEIANLRREIDDFAEYEQEVLAVLEDARAEKTRDNILGAYTMLVGKKTIEERNRSKNAALNPDRPAPDHGEAPKQYAKTALSEEIRVGLGMSEKDYYEDYATPDSGTSKIKVPR